MGPGALVIGAIALVAALSSGSKPSTKGPIKVAPNPFANGGTGTALPNKWSIVGCDPFHTPSGGTQAPTPGVQSHADYQWCYVVRAGDTPGDVAAMILGPDQGWRYVELLTANPEKATKGSVIAPDASPDAELNFTKWEAGEIVRLPRTWNPWIDQVGSPRGESAPYMPAGFGAAA